MFILKRYYKFYKTNGFFKSILKIISTPLRLIYKIIYNDKKKEYLTASQQKKDLN